MDRFFDYCVVIGFNSGIFTLIADAGYLHVWNHSEEDAPSQVF